jgi:hypothetical protein
VVKTFAGWFTSRVPGSPWLLEVMTLVAIAALAVPIGLRAQTSSASSAIEGTVRDESGAVMPGVTLTLTSPQLQVPQIVEVTDAEGVYRFSGLRVGVYRVQSDLSGFQSFIRENLQLDSGFVARVDMVLKVGALEESVTVSGASPVVDVVTTRGGQTLTTDLAVKTLPMLGHQADMVRLVPGLEGGIGGRAANPTGMGQGYNISISAYGQAGTTAYLEDFEIHQITQPALTSQTEQLDVRSYGNGAQNHMAGVALNYIFPSGGNQFHGRAETSYVGRSLVSNNLTDELVAQGLTVGEVTSYHTDSSASLSGKILPDKLWFFTAGRWRQARKTQAGTVANAGPDGRYLTGDEPAAWLPYRQYGIMTKGSLQVSPKYQVVGIFYHDKAENDGTAAVTGGLPASARTIPFEASTTYKIPEHFWDGQFRGTPRNDLSFYVVGGRSSFETQYFCAPGVDPLVPTRYDRNTQLMTGCPISNGTYIAAERTGRTWHYMLGGTVSYVPAGGVFNSKHQMKVGYKTLRKAIGPRAPTHRAGDYLLIYDRGAPSEIYVFYLPVDPVDRDNVDSLFVEDAWRATDRITLNLGLRVERSRSFVPPQQQQAGQFVQARDYEEIEVGAWTTLAPRLAAAWDITGSGKSVVKASWGIYNDLIFGAINSYAENHNPVTGTVHSYRWRDQDLNNNYTPGEVNLDLNGPDYLTLVTGGNTLSRLPDAENFVVPHGTELALSVEHELMPSMGGKFLFIQKSRYGSRSQINPARPYGVYNIPLPRRDPGPDGNVNTADDGPMVTIYDYDPAYRGNAFEKEQAVNEPDDLHDTATTFEGSVSKRFSNRWAATMSFGATHQSQRDFPQNPNAAQFDVTDHWSQTLRANGSYELPWRISLGTSLNMLSGVKNTRTYIFRAADPLGGSPLRQLSTVTLRLEEPGQTRGPIRTYWDLRVGRAFTVGGNTLDTGVDVLNVLNSAAVEGLNAASGPTFGQINLISAPRMVRVGVQYRF